MPQYRELNEKFFDRWSKEMAYVLGYIFADGSVFKNPRGSEYLEMSSTDKELIILIKSLMRAGHKIGIYPQKNSKWKTKYKLQIGNQHMMDRLHDLGIIPRKSLVIKFPDVPKRFLGDFVRGYFDGDGSVNLGRYWRKDRQKWKLQFDTRFTSGSEDFLKDLFAILGAHLKGGYLYKKSLDSGFELVFARQDSLNLFKFMYGDRLEDLYLERKYKVFQEAIKLFS